MVLLPPLQLFLLDGEGTTLKTIPIAPRTLVDAALGKDGRIYVIPRGEEFCYVLEGELFFRVEGQEFVLQTGDSIHVESSTLHVCFTKGPQPARSLWVLTPRLM